VEGLAYGAFRWCPTRDLGPRRVGQQAEHALVAEASDVLEVDQLAVDRGLIELEVTGVHDVAERCADTQTHSVGDGVSDTEGRDIEVTQLDCLARVQCLERIVAELVLLDLVADEAARQGRGVDGHAGELGQHVWQSADVVLMGVGDDDGLDLLAPAAQVRDVGDDDVDPVHILIRKRQAAVDDDDLVVELEHRHVLADLADTTERRDAQDVLGGLGGALDGHLEESVLIVGWGHGWVLWLVGRG